MCDQKHTFAMKLTCSAAFSTTCNILHLCSFILLKCLGFKDTPRRSHASGVLKNLDTRRAWIEESAVGETVSGIIVWYLSETLQSLWAREQGEAGISLSKSATEHKYNPCVGLLQPGPWPWYKNFIGLSPSSLVWFHNQPTVYKARQWEVTAGHTQYKIMKPEREVPAQWTTPEILTRRALHLFPLHYALHINI